MSVELDAAFHYNDLQGLNNLKSGARQDSPEALRAVSQQFESMFISLIMKSMRDATDVLASDLENSYQTKFYRDMHDQQMALTLSQKGGFGLADVLYQQLSGNGFRSDRDPSIDVMSLQESNALNEFSLAELVTSGTDNNSLDILMPARYLPESTEQKQPAEDAPVLTPGNLLSEPAANEMADEAALNPGVEPEVDDYASSSDGFHSPEEFISTLLPIAERKAPQIGIDPKVLVAQAALETGWGQKMIQHEDGSSANNLFGIKADQRWQGNSANTVTHEYVDGTAIKISAQFRAYQSLEDSVEDYLSFVSESDRYHQAIANAKDPNLYLQALQDAGYATDPNYAQKITRIMNSDFFGQS